MLVVAIRVVCRVGARGTGVRGIGVRGSGGSIVIDAYNLEVCLASNFTAFGGNGATSTPAGLGDDTPPADL